MFVMHAPCQAILAIRVQWLRGLPALARAASMTILWAARPMPCKPDAQRHCISALPRPLRAQQFLVCEVDGGGHVLRRQDLKRDAFALWLVQVPAGTVVANC